MITELLVAFGMMSLPNPNIGNCAKYNFPDGSTITQCRYDHEPPKMDDDLIAELGKHYKLGPWATVVDDIIHPAILSLAGSNTIVLNAKFGGGAFLTLSPGASLIYHNVFTGSPNLLDGLRIEHWQKEDIRRSGE